MFLFIASLKPASTIFLLTVCVRPFCKAIIMPNFIVQCKSVIFAIKGIEKVQIPLLPALVTSRLDLRRRSLIDKNGFLVDIRAGV